jgi:hypothetical protein
MKPKIKKHYFSAPPEDKNNIFCQCGKYLTHEIHFKVKIIDGKQINY